MNIYDPNELYKKDSKKKKGWKKGLLIFILIVVILIVFCTGCNILFDNGMNKLGIKPSVTSDYKYHSDYIGVLTLQGTISESGSNSSDYNQDWLMARVRQMKLDDKNRGIIIKMNTPGGSVYATDELYLALEDYKKDTGRPVYTYMESMAASGGYYIACASDKIYANRNCWTGSIGVTIGTIYDISGFLDKMGVKTVTITSGANKTMGSSVEPMTKEQREIFQGLVDDSYDQFVSVVAKGRDMNIKKVKRLADGRVYTAKQAENTGLIDEIGTFQEAAADMKEKYGLSGCDMQQMKYSPSTSLRSLLLGLAKNKSESAQSQYDELMNLVNENNRFTVTYMSQIQK